MTDINIGAITESLNYKSDLDLGNTSPQLVDYIVEQQLPSADNNYTWYDLYKSGKVVQGGFSSIYQAPMTVNLPITMASKDYEIILSNAQGTGIMTTMTGGTRNSTTTSFTVASTTSNIFDWMVIGMSAGV